MRFVVIVITSLVLFGCQSKPSSAKSPEKVLNDIVSAYITEHSSPEGYLYAYGGDRLSTRDSMIAALYWANAGEVDRASKIVEAVLPLQYIGCMQRHYGNFPTLAGGEPPFDYNWSAFIGSYLVLLYRQHKDSFPDELQQDIVFALEGLASHRLAQLWNRPETTNINILSTFFLLQAAAVLEDSGMRQEAEAFWADFYAQSLNEGIREYGGLSYMSVHLYGLDFISQYEQNTTISKQARDLQQRLLWGLTHRYQYANKQLAGPFRRTPEDSRMGGGYSTLEAMLFRASGGTFPLSPKLPENSDPLHGTFALLLSERMPKAWVDGVRDGKNLNMHYRESIAKTASGVHIQTTSYLEPGVLVGSVNHEPIKLVKRQVNRPLIAHLENSEIRLLASGTQEHGNDIHFNSVQDKKTVLAEVVREKADEDFRLWLDVLSENARFVECGNGLADMIVDDSRVVLSAAEGVVLGCEEVGQRLAVVLESDNSEPMAAYPFVMSLDVDKSVEFELPDSYLENGDRITKWSHGSISLLLKRDDDRVDSKAFKVNGQNIELYPLGGRMGEFFDHN